MIFLSSIYISAVIWLNLFKILLQKEHLKILCCCLLMLDGVWCDTLSDILCLAAFSDIIYMICADAENSESGDDLTIDILFVDNFREFVMPSWQSPTIYICKIYLKYYYDFTTFIYSLYNNGCRHGSIRTEVAMLCFNFAQFYLLKML